MALSGKYELLRDEGYLEHMLAVGVPEDFVKKSVGQKSLEISISGDKVSINRGDGRPAQVFTVGQEVEETYPNGKTAKNKATVNGNVLTIDSEVDGGKWKRDYSLAGSELTVISTHSKPGVPVGKRVFKKL